MTTSKQGRECWWRWRYYTAARTALVATAQCSNASPLVELYVFSFHMLPFTVEMPHT